jgi:predicted nucleotidyltransferase component of viral defense system
MSVGPILGFKGGTAAYMFYNLNRFSVDLDFDLLDNSKTTFIFERIGEIAKKYGTIKENYQKKNTIFFLLSYEEHTRNIKIEINLREFGSTYEVKGYFGIAMKVMVRGDMCAHKLVAMIEREGKTNRDIYDTWFFLKNNWPVNKEIIGRRTNMSCKDILKKGIDLLERKSRRNILSGMGELLDPEEKARVKMNLLKDTIFLLKVRLDAEK